MFNSLALEHHSVLFRLTRVMSGFSFMVDYAFLFTQQTLNDQILCARQYAWGQVWC